MVGKKKDATITTIPQQPTSLFFMGQRGVYLHGALLQLRGAGSFSFAVPYFYLP